MLKIRMIKFIARQSYSEGFVSLKCPAFDGHYIAMFGQGLCIILSFARHFFECVGIVVDVIQVPMGNKRMTFITSCRVDDVSEDALLCKLSTPGTWRSNCDLFMPTDKGGVGPHRHC